MDETIFKGISYHSMCDKYIKYSDHYYSYSIRRRMQASQGFNKNKSSVFAAR
ncbi:hypothetical protein JCM16418A_08120 [Paenibacillus pini]|uniref:Uncharacterized protein n=1 Tax=Paenibacillus pini JCM 16418 TaxID=1236976 RepID=W7YPY5_9BACL|nr:hypothetical protein JCM16418_569 [Paenibacillus pini JCM 16418]